jgi:hypothetical protein
MNNKNSSPLLFTLLLLLLLGMILDFIFNRFYLKDISQRLQKTELALQSATDSLNKSRDSLRFIMQNLSKSALKLQLIRSDVEKINLDYELSKISSNKRTLLLKGKLLEAEKADNQLKQEAARFPQ